MDSSAPAAPAIMMPLSQEAEPEINPWLVAVTVILPTFMQLLDTDVAGVILPHIAGSLSATLNESTWVITSHLIAIAIILPLSGWFCDTIGRTRFYTGCVVAFTVSSLCCGLAPNLPTLILFRIIQGVGGGGLQPTAQAILADTFPPAKRSMAFAIYGMAVVVAPAISPTLGGWITDNSTWRWVFFINVPLGMLSLLLISRFLKDPPILESEERTSRMRVDWLGMGMLAWGLGALEFVLDKGQEDDWFGSRRIVIMLATAVVCLLGVLIRDLVIKNPIIDLKLFRFRNFAIANILGFFLGFVLNSSIILVPQYLQTMMDYSATQAGLVLSAGSAIYVVMMPFVGKMIPRVGARPLVIFGFTTVGISLIWTSRLNLQTDFWTVSSTRTLCMIGMACLFTPVSLICYSTIPMGKNNAASSLYNMIRNLGASIGISSLSTVLVRRSQLHQARLVEHITSDNLLYRIQQSQMSQYIRMHADGLETPTSRAVALLYRSVVQQATALAYLDVFWLLGVISFMMPIVALFVLRGATRSKA